MSKTDPPEDIEDFFHRFMETPGVQNDMWANWYEFGLPEYQQQEREKLEYRKQLEKERKEHETTVERLAAQIERERLRISREEARKREREAEIERRDPTPNILPASSIPKIPFEIRDQHVFVPGMTRHGKSSQLFHLILDDINNDRGVALLDPIKGDLITELLPHIPKRRLKDCIYLDLRHPIPLDVMRPTPNPEDLVGDIKALILKGNTTLARAEPILTRLIYALLLIPGSKFTDIEDVFTIPRRKDWFLENLEKIDPRRYEYWKDNWPSGGEFSPLLSRMTDFTENPSLRVILGDPFPILNLRKAMDERKIILVNLPGSSEVTQIYGSLLVSRFQQAAFSRANVPKNERVPFCLYVDEFEIFQTSSFAKILEAAGGLKLYLTLGNQHIFSTIIHPYKPHHLGQIPKHQAIFRIGDNPPEFHWTKAPPPPNEKLAEQIRQRLIQQTKETYATYGTIRSGDNTPSNSSTLPHNEGNDRKDEDIKPSGAV
jgi:hypothetical protein